MKTKLSDVAALAGVGLSTVSRVLRKEGSYSDEARDAVLRAAEMLGYVPNRLASSLSNSGSRLVALIVPSLTNILFADVLKGAGQHLDSAGYSGVFGVTDYDPAKEERLVEALLEYRPAAILITGWEHTARTTALLARAGCRVVEMLDTDGPCIDLGVGFSSRKAGEAAARHLLDCGYRRIGYVAHDLKHDVRAARRLEAFRNVLDLAGCPLIAEERSADVSSVTAGRAATAALLARHPDLDAVYFSNDDMAIGGSFHCLQAGIAVPGRLGLVGQNGLDIGQALPQPLTTIRAPLQAIGRRAAELALSDAPAGTTDMGFEVLQGATTAPRLR